jgi:hypothetical protein
MAGRKRIYATRAEQQAAYRERNNLVNLCVQIDAGLKNEFEQWLKFKDREKSEVIEKLLRTQLLRKR